MRSKGRVRGAGGAAARWSAWRGNSTLRGVKRWLVLGIALALAAAALAAIVGELGRRGPSTGGPPMDQIDAASRQRLEQVLRQEDER
jgi:hypothetical protein